MLIDIPCAVGADVWVLKGPNIEHTTVEKVVICREGVYLKLAYNAVYETSAKGIGKTIFFNEAEAIKVLDSKQHKR